LARVRVWFDLNADERLVLAGILAIAVIGLVARALYLDHRAPAPYEPRDLPREERATP
jgi:hypothetical protein